MWHSFGCSYLLIDNKAVHSDEHETRPINLDIWLAVHHSITFFIITNLIHKFLVRSHKLHKIKFLYMFRAQSAHHQEVNDSNCTYAVSGIVTL